MSRVPHGLSSLKLFISPFLLQALSWIGRLMFLCLLLPRSSRYRAKQVKGLQGQVAVAESQIAVSRSQTGEVRHAENSKNKTQKHLAIVAQTTPSLRAWGEPAVALNSPKESNLTALICRYCSKGVVKEDSGVRLFSFDAADISRYLRAAIFFSPTAFAPTGTPRAFVIRPT